MRKTTRMMRTIVPIPMYMAFPLVAVNAGAQVLPCQQTLALPTVGLSKPGLEAGRRIVKDRQGSASPANRPPKEVCTR
jgi:hypothetical protein